MDWCSHTWGTPPLGMPLPRGCRSESQTPSWGLTTAHASHQGLQNPLDITGVPPRPTTPAPVHRLVTWEHVKIVSGSPGNHRSRWKPEWTVSESLRVEGGSRALSVGVQCGPGRAHPSCPSSQDFLETTRSDAQREEKHKGAAPLPRLSPQSVPRWLPRPCPVGH